LSSPNFDLSSPNFDLPSPNFDLSSPNFDLSSRSAAEGSASSSSPAPTTPPLRFLDNRTYQTNPDGSVFGWNGYMKLAIAGDTVTARYYDIAGILSSGACDEFAEADDSDKLLLEDRFTLAPDGTIGCETTQHNLESNFYGPQKWG
jgi:hypothetical protein